MIRTGERVTYNFLNDCYRAPPNTAFQSDPRRPALYKIGRILTCSFNLSMLAHGAGG